MHGNDRVNQFHRTSLGWKPGIEMSRANLFKPRIVTAQERCDEIQAEARLKPGDRIRRGALALVLPLEPSPDLTDRRLAEEIDYARRLLQAVGECLACDALVLARHATTLQSFDIVGQALGHLATVVGAADREEAIDRIGMEDLRTRIRRRSLRDGAFSA